MISAPSEMRCKSIPMASMIGRMIATVSGIAKATTAPGRAPRLAMLQAMIIAMACQRDVMNSPIACFTTTGWSDTKVTSIPSGRFAVAELIAFFHVFAQRQDVAALTIAIIAKTMKDRCFSAQSERLGPIMTALPAA